MNSATHGAKIRYQVDLVRGCPAGSKNCSVPWHSLSGVAQVNWNGWCLGESTMQMSYYYYYYYYFFRVFPISLSWWYFTGFWEIASLLWSLRLFSVFWPILTILSFGWFRFVLWFPSLPVPLQLVSPLFSCSPAFLVLRQGSSTYLSFRFSLVFHSLVHRGGKFSFFFVNYRKVWSSGRDLVICLYL